MGQFRRYVPASAKRRIALHSWRAPNDPQIRGQADIEMTNALDYIRAVREATGERLTVTHLVGKAFAEAIALNPKTNGLARGRRLLERDTVDVFFVVAHGDGEEVGGVIVREADKKSIDAIAAEVQAKVGGVRRGEDKEDAETQAVLDRIPYPLLGSVIRFIHWLQYNRGFNLERFGVPQDPFGSVLITSLGMHGLSHGFSNMSGIVPTSIEVFVGEVDERAWVIDGKIEARPGLTVGVTLDHRIIDGFDAAILGQDFKRVMSDPAKALGMPVPKDLSA